MSQNRLLYLSRADVERIGPSMEEIIDALEITFRAKGQGRIEMPPKPSIHPGGGDNFMNAMLAYIPDLRSAGVKWVGGFPQNPSKGLPYISGLLIFNDVETGMPLSVMDCTWITAKRTGAATALSARYLARPDSSVMGVLGCGVQGRSHVEALRILFPLTKIKAYDVNPDAQKRYAEEITHRFDLEVDPVKSPQEAVTECDIVVTAAPIKKKPHATIQPGWIAEGTFASLVDYDSYWHCDAMKEADKFCTDDIPQLRLYQDNGYLQDIPEIYADLGELVTGQKPGRQSEQERNMTVNLGNALDDMAVAPLIYRNAAKEKVGAWLDL